MSQIIASVSGVRGIYGDNLTPENINKFTSAFSYYCSQVSKSKKIVIGRDGRLFGDVVSGAAISYLVLSGFEVVDIGIAPTPTVQLATEKLKAAGGIAVTASHNPQNWNGLKFLNPDGTFLDPAQIKKFLAFAQKPAYPVAPVEKLKEVIRDFTWCEKHIDMVLKLKAVGNPLGHLNAIRKRKFKVAASVAK